MNDTYDQLLDSSSNLSIYHATISEDEETLECGAVLVGFDYDPDLNYQFTCQDFRVVVEGTKELVGYEASLYWNEDTVSLKIVDVHYYKSYNDFLCHNPPRYATSSTTQDFEDSDKYEDEY
jgi:hypothetical protein